MSNLINPNVKLMTTEESKELMYELLKSRDLIEKSLRQSIVELENMGIGLNESLFDSEGFPRDDIDLYVVRALRLSITRQQNDYKSVMQRIEYLLPLVIPSQSSNFPLQISSMNYLEPFAKIGLVPIESYAFKIGICSNDFILKFGEITKETFVPNDLKVISEEFSRLKMNGLELDIKLKRSINDFVVNSIKIDCKLIESLGCQILLL